MNFKTLSEPYPFDDSTKKAVVKAVGFGLFIFLFLYFFQPFGLGNYKSETKGVELLGYGGVTAICLLLNHFGLSVLLPKWYSKKTWTVGKNILLTLWIFFFIGLVNLLYSVFLKFLPFSFSSILMYQGITLSIGIIPVVFSTLLVYQKRNSSMLKEAENLNSSLQTTSVKKPSVISIPSTNKSENFEVDAHSLLYVKAVENYIELYTKENEILHKKIIRTTLKSIDSTFEEFLFIQKCHRSFLVNLNKVNHFSGNAQGLTLSFENSDELSVPVSRAFVKAIKEQLAKKI